MDEETKAQVQAMIEEQFPALVDKYFGRTVVQIRSYLTEEIE